MKRRRRRPWLQRMGFGLLLLLGSISCSTLQSAIRVPGKLLREIAPGEEASLLDVDRLTLRLMRYADLSTLRITRATEAFAAQVGTPEARIQALAWQIDYTRVLWRLASGPQPYESLFSTIAVVTSVRRAHEVHWLPRWGQADLVVLEALTLAEADAWSLASAAVGAVRVDQARELITRWVEGRTGIDSGDVNTLPAFGEILASQALESDAPELAGLINLDPLSGLEPAVAEVEQSRRLAERALYYLQHLPSLLSAQVELTGLRSLQLPEVGGALADWQRFSAASASFAATAEGLPATLASEREALLAQLSLEITAQREGLLRDLESAREPLNEILRNTQGTAVAGREMSVALTAALEAGLELSRAIDALRQPSDRGASETGEGPRPPRRPFDITEYTLAAESLARTAHALTETISSLDRSLPQLQLAVGEALAHGDRTVDRAFRRALQLLLVALLGGALTVLAVRWITMRWGAKSGRSAPG